MLRIRLRYRVMKLRAPCWVLRRLRAQARPWFPGVAPKTHAGGVADLKICDQHEEFKKRAWQAVPEISGTRDNHCERERKRRGQNQNIEKSPEDRPYQEAPDYQDDHATSPQ
jgi:hypothetical protein